MSLFAIQDVKWVAAQGKFSIHVQSNGMDILTKQDIQISSVDGQIVITAPNGISIKSRNSEIKLDDAGIGLITSHVLEHKAGQHVFKTGSIIDFERIHLPDIKNPYIVQYLVRNKENENLINRPFILIDEQGNVQKGKTDNKGFMNLKTTPSSQMVAARVMPSEIEEATEEEVEKE
ncbi:DUF2345 domain-containing protein [Acinetobacter rongchengensis]|uniref:DUF2345 domain-containing protein n=2 Tax=Acinetobacter rongchengensis TaxID=2419601 RepID=A0A3A8EA49_9GAMM|nr:DUF2345 domain-containing protein [Acinetobacter rongchengensis]